MDMRAKFQITKVEQYRKDGLPDGAVVGERIEFMAVTSKPYDANGFNEDNTYAAYTPNGGGFLVIYNPALLGQYTVGMKLYSDFTVATE